jgi:hypothetical protein
MRPPWVTPRDYGLLVTQEKSLGPDAITRRFLWKMVGPPGLELQIHDRPIKGEVTAIYMCGFLIDCTMQVLYHPIFFIRSRLFMLKIQQVNYFLSCGAVYAGINSYFRKS